MNCRTVQNLTSAYLEGETTAEERSALEAHLPLCRECTADLHETRRMMSLLHGLPRVDASPDFTDVVMQQVREATAEEFESARGWRRFLPEVMWPQIEWQRLVWAPAAMAAGVLLTLGGIRLGVVPVAGLTAPARTVASAPMTLVPAPSVVAPSVASTLAPRAVAVASHHATRSTRTAAASQPVATEVAARNPLGESQILGNDAFELRGHDLLDPSYGAQVDLVLDRVSLDGRPLPTGTIQPVHEQRRPERRLRTF